MTKEQKQKRSPTVVVSYSSGIEVLVQRFPLMSKPGLAEFKELYHQLLFCFVRHNGALGEVLSDPKTIGYIRQVAAMIPVVGQSKPGINIDDLFESDDREQICRLFFTESIQDDGEYETDENGRQKGFSPSSLAKLNQLDFFGVIARAYEQIRTEDYQQEAITEMPDLNSKALEAVEV